MSKWEYHLHPIIFHYFFCNNAVNVQTRKMVPYDAETKICDGDYFLDWFLG